MLASAKGGYTRSFISEDWTRDSAKTTAAAEELILTDDHFLVLHALQAYYSRHGIKLINVRELRDALDEKFYHKGGMKFLYSLFPHGPIAQGCRIAGLQPPAGAVDKGFGSVV